MNWESYLSPEETETYRILDTRVNGLKAEITHIQKEKRKFMDRGRKRQAKEGVDKRQYST